MERIFDLPELKETARIFWEEFPDQKVFAFQGQMGAGKTSFIRTICELLQVRETVGSPTFSIINEYSFQGGIVFHLDLYRLKDEDEAVRSGVEDCLYSGAICLVEWPDRAPGIFPEDTVGILLETIDENTRKISTTPNWKKFRIKL